DASGRPRLARGADAGKDQSYVLHMLRSADLARLRFPVGHLSKAEVRRIAAERGLPTATKADSQDVCFVTRAQGRRRFLEDRIELHPAEVVDSAGRPLGRAEAVELVTIGQRRGLELAGGAARRYVTAVDVPRRRVVVGRRE